jgi:hypothetical protein
MERTGGFAWWEPHDRATRWARVLLVGAAGVVAAYIASLIVVVFVCLGAADVGPWRSVVGA